MTGRTFHTDSKHITRDGRKAKITDFNKGGEHLGYIINRAGRRIQARWTLKGEHWFYGGERPHPNDLFDAEETQA